ncbi:hypothetical protein C8Q79DRAFT_671986 [Trametes meyenii]|nr:hypothetical protein C8Q79DRAFT_671986 [Trametes meyenii]
MRPPGLPFRMKSLLVVRASIPPVRLDEHHRFSWTQDDVQNIRAHRGYHDLPWLTVSNYDDPLPGSNSTSSPRRPAHAIHVFNANARRQLCMERLAPTAFTAFSFASQPCLRALCHLSGIVVSGSVYP